MESAYFNVNIVANIFRLKFKKSIKKISLIKVRTSSFDNKRINSIFFNTFCVMLLFIFRNYYHCNNHIPNCLLIINNNINNIRACVIINFNKISL